MMRHTDDFTIDCPEHPIPAAVSPEAGPDGAGTCSQTPVVPAPSHPSAGPALDEWFADLEAHLPAAGTEHRNICIRQHSRVWELRMSRIDFRARAGFDDPAPPFSVIQCRTAISRLECMLPPTPRAPDPLAKDPWLTMRALGLAQLWVEQLAKALPDAEAVVAMRCFDEIGERAEAWERATTEALPC